VGDRKISLDRVKDQPILPVHRKIFPAGADRKLLPIFFQRKNILLVMLGDICG